MNRNSFNIYIQSLRQLLLEIFDDHTGAFSDWDWQWPQLEALNLRRHEWRQLALQTGAVPVTVVQKITDLYSALDDMPPPMDGWVDAWDGNIVSFLPFLLDRLEDERRLILERIDACCSCLNALASEVDGA
ncbi:MAG: hypothetical protein GIW99_05405 [Candidatus Eremiobacteraeota bacterium]|nr:hypothetical protein [Candidatus Eremiobacteraeota bacterium]